MIIKNDGNVLDVKSGVIVHGCNSHGVMGSGVAAEIKRRYPEAFRVYIEAYAKEINSGSPGLPLGSFTWCEVGKNKYIVNAVTQKDYGRDPDKVYVDYFALEAAFSRIPVTPILSGCAKEFGVHFPLIGCGLARGKWEIVEPLIDVALTENIKKNLWIFNP